MGRSNHSTKARHWEQIDEEKRYKIEGLLEAGQRKGKIAKLLGMSERTIRREIEMGSVIQRDCELRDRLVYKADYAQRVHAERASNKGRGFKIGHDHALCRYLEQKIGVEKYSPDAAIGEIRRGKLQIHRNAVYEDRLQHDRPRLLSEPDKCGFAGQESRKEAGLQVRAEGTES